MTRIHKLSIIGAVFTFILVVTLMIIRPDGSSALFNNSQDDLSSNAALKKPKIVVIDAGHGGYDPGSIGINGTLEKDLVLPISLKVGAILNNEGIRVIYTRKNDNVPWLDKSKQGLDERAAISNNSKADLFVSIHLNSFKKEGVKGTETYYNEESAQGKKLAELIHNQIIETVNFKDRGIRTEGYYLLENVTAPAALIELGYISNRNEEALLKDPSIQDKFSQSIAAGIKNYLNLEE